MKVLLDECVDWRLGRERAGHDVTTVQAIGWAGVRNGNLLGQAQDIFDVLVTVDRKLPLQHDLAQFNLAVAVLRARRSRLADLRALVPVSAVVPHPVDHPGSERNPPCAAVHLNRFAHLLPRVFSLEARQGR